ncbi:PAS domain S-box protein [Cellulophaga tyrosinoxydans]|uniref:histidine kinase n=1 Tax=Cellulophaga tyrosinoxydans TaxID=504486 RepID=A0A1W1YTZ2_9FLAO|nr:PAS domain S-box protein [Cellulophaga tyrosinoxydans]SMC39680.1 PAS domain S-box-containing protein [Cellulophaga tyrosinoxydans]
MSRKLKFRFFEYPILYGIVVFFLLLILTQFLAYERYQMLKKTDEKETVLRANWIENEFQKILNQSFSTTQTLAFIVKNYGVPKNFDSIAHLLLETNKNIDALELVDSLGVITNVYPIEGNNIKGFNILNDTIGRKGALITMQRKEYFVTGPIKLKQGGDGLVSRIPIFKDDKFQGFSAAVIKLPNLLQAIQISKNSEGKYAYQLAKVNADKTEEIFFSTNSFSEKNAYSKTISMTKGEWKLSVFSKKKELFTTVLSFSILGLLLAIIGGVFVWYLLRQPNRLDKLVKEKSALLIDSEEKYRLLIENATDGIFLLDQNANFLDVNIQLISMFKASKEYFIGKNVLDFIEPECLHKIPLKFDDLKKGQTVSSVRKLIRKDKTKFLAETRVKMLPNNLFQGILQDITEKEKATAQIKESEQKYRELTERITDAFVAFDLNWNFTYISAKAKEFIPPNYPELIGKNIWEVFPNFIGTALHENFYVAMETQTIKQAVRYSEPLAKWIEYRIYPSLTGVSAYFSDVTAVKKAEEEVLYTKAKMESAIRIGKIGYWSWDLRDNSLEWSQRMYTIFDMDKNTPLNFESAAACIHPDDRQMHEDLIANRIEHKDNTPFSFRVLHKDNSIHHVLVELEILYNDDEEINKLHGTAVDITDRILEQLNLKESQEKFYKSFHSNLAGKVIVDEERTILEANETVATLLETTRENLIGKKLIDADVLDFNKHEQSENRKVVWNKLLKQGFLRDEEITYTLKSGKQIPALISIEPLELENKTHYLVSAIDNTKRKEAEEELVKSEARFRKLASTTPVGIFQSDASGACTYVNAEWLKYSGIEFDEAMGNGWINSTYSPDRKRVSKEWEQTIAVRKIFKSKFRLQHKNGKIITLSVKAIPLYGIDDEFVGFIGMASDISNLILAEKRLEAQNIELSKTNAELDRFVYSASHELRAPLASVLGLINIILSEEKEPDLVFKLQMMEQSVKRLDSFIKDIVQYSQNRHLEVASEKIDFHSLVQDSLESFWYLENRSQINIHVNITDTLAFYSDKKRISIILNNLISNAIKYHNVAGSNPIININITTTKDQGIIAIKDNGLGIPQEHLKSIFKMFYRVSSKIMGTGIGLFVVKEIVEKIDGKITVESEENKGTTFTVILPNQMK